MPDRTESRDWPRTFRLADVSRQETHIPTSLTLITEAGALAGPERAAVLGCGACHDIPLGALTDRFERLDLVDLDVGALQSAVARLNRREDLRCECSAHACDITGLMPAIQVRAKEIADGELEPEACLDRLGRLLSSTPPAFWAPESEARYSLVVCSGVLTQLQASVRRRIEDIFVARFRSKWRLLLSYRPWIDRVWEFARKLERAFVDHLDTLALPRAVIYLADTVHVSWLSQIDSATLTAPGSWIATKSANLEDYLDSSYDIRARRRWDWFRQKQEGRFWGRLYGVQALIYQTKPIGKQLLEARDG